MADRTTAAQSVVGDCQTCCGGGIGTIPVPCCDPDTQQFPTLIYVDTPGGSLPFGDTLPAMTAVPMTASLLSGDVYWWRSDLIDVGSYFGGGRLMVAYAVVSCSDSDDDWNFTANLYQNDALHPLYLMLATASGFNTDAPVDCAGLDVTLDTDPTYGTIDTSFHFYG